MLDSHVPEPQFEKIIVHNIGNVSSIDRVELDSVLDKSSSLLFWGVVFILYGVLGIGKVLGLSTFILPVRYPTATYGVMFLATMASPFEYPFQKKPVACNVTGCLYFIRQLSFSTLELALFLEQSVTLGT